jgi:hypothetical protein
MEMSVEDFNDYWISIAVLEAQEALVCMGMHDWPSLKRNDRSDRHRKLHATAYPRAWEQSKEVSGDQMASIIKGLVGGR